jgi:DNA-binding response OmpR family regulator
MSDGDSREPVIWIISSEQWPRAMLRAELIEHSIDAIGYLTMDQALIELSRWPSQKPQAIILDLSDQDITRERFRALVREDIPIVILGGSVELGNPIIREFTWAGTFRRPFMIREVVALIDQLVPRTG